MSENYFNLFGLNQAFTIDLATLESRYRKIQSASHPDRFVTASPAEKLKSMQTATLANEAYDTLKSPALRAQYLLKLNNINATQETNTAMPADFLMQQMEWREMLEDLKAAENISGLGILAKDMKQEAHALIDHLAIQLDEKKDLVAATETARKLIFINKVCEDINQAITQIEQ